MKAALMKLVRLPGKALREGAEFAEKDSILAGCAVIVAGVLLTAASNRSAEAYSMAMQSQCASTVTAAAVIELAGADCASAQAAGHAPAVIELCRLTHGRSADQVADLPQCQKDAP